ncbi:rab-GTPase-TBC domain-containing protein [Phlebopus sp. FC_14]|nr:rab-GTPase-TBC domain-containing protein [Phlebopus sp. FC_14]
MQRRQHESSVVSTTNDEALTWDSLRVRSLDPGGFGEDRVRIWPALLGVQPLSDPPPYSEVASDLFDETVHGGDDRPGHGEADPHPDEHQIRLDTDRSFVLYPEDSSVAPSREAMQMELHGLIVSLFRKHRSLHYFQGCHDILSVLFLTLPRPLHLACAEKMSLHRIRDSMGVGLEPVVGLLRILRNLLRLVDPEYAELLESVSPLPYHALPHLLTLFAHDVPTLSLIQHVWDFLLTREPLAVVWLVAAFVLYRKPSIYLLAERDEEGMIHSLLGALPELVDSEHDSVFETRHDEEGDETDLEITDGEHPGSMAPADGNSLLEPPIRSNHDEGACLAINSDQPSQLVNLMNGNTNATPGITGSNDEASHPNKDTLEARDTTNYGTQQNQNCSDERSGSRRSMDISQDTNSSSSSPGEPSCAPAVRDLSTESPVTPEGTSTDSATSGETGAETRFQIDVSDPCPSPILPTQPRPSLSSRRSSSRISSNPSCDAPRPTPSVPSPSPSPRKRSPSKYRNAPLSLPHLLRQTDALLAAYPPSHPSLRVRQTMGPDSVVWTWREPNLSQIPTETPHEQSDDYLESLVNSSHIVLPTPPPSPPPSPPLPDKKLKPWRPSKAKALLSPRKIRLSLGALTPTERKVLFVGALLVVGAAIALKTGKIPRTGEVGNGKGDAGEGLNRLWHGRWWSVVSSVVSAWGRVADIVRWKNEWTLAIHGGHRVGD